MLKKLVLISALALSALGQTPSTPGQPLSLDTSSRVKRSFKIPAAKTFTLESGSTLAIDDGTVFSIGSTAASSLRTAIGDLNGMKTWTSAANRALSTPTFLGQLGIQTDTSYLYRASGTGQGDWDSLVNMQTIYTEGVTITSGGISSTSTTGAAISAYRDGGVYAAPIVLIDNDVSSSPGLSVGSTGTGALIQTTTGGVVTSTIDKNGVFLIGYGAVGGPGLSFYGDADTGLYRSGANTIGVATNGTNVATFATTGFSVTGTLSASGAFTAGSSILSGGLSATTGTFTTSVISPNLAPTGNLTLTQNSVVPFTSVASGALVDTLTLKAGKVGIGTNNPTVLQV